MVAVDWVKCVGKACGCSGWVWVGIIISNSERVSREGLPRGFPEGICLSLRLLRFPSVGAVRVWTPKIDMVTWPFLGFSELNLTLEFDTAT